MYRDICVICDSDPEYAMQLSFYINDRAGIPFEAHPFSDPGQLALFADQNKIGVLLMDENLYTDQIRSLAVPLVILLSTVEKDFPEHPGLCKYRPADDLLHDILALYEKHYALPKQSGEAFGDSDSFFPDMKIFALYSPVGRCGKTGFALSAGGILGKYRRTLYLNLEDYHGFSELGVSGGDRTLSDILYMNRWKKDLLPLRLSGCIRSIDTLDFVQPPAVSVDYRDVPATEWAEVFAAFKEAGYERLILDIGSQMMEPCSLLRLCDRIFVPAVPDDPIGLAKLGQFHENLLLLNQGILEDRIIRLEVPLPGKTQDLFHAGAGQYLMALSKGPIGRYARRVLEEIGEI